MELNRDSLFEKKAIANIKTSMLKTTHEMREATKFSEAELEFINDMSQAVFDEAVREDHRPYILLALCGAIASNVVIQSDYQCDVDTALMFVELATKSQLTKEI